MVDRLAMAIPSPVAAIVPILCGVLGVVVSNVPISLTGGLVPPPLLGFMPVYFWSLVRPDLMPPAAVFFVGLCEDLLSGSPPGLWSASFLASYIFVARQRDTFAGLAGLGAILGFALAAIVASASAYAVASAYFWRFPPAAPLVLQFIVTVAFYIPALPVLNRIQRRAIGPARSGF